MASYRTGILADGSPFIINVGGQLVPITISLTSAATTRLIRVSTTAGAGSYQNVVYDVVTTTTLSLGIDIAIRSIEVTGQAGDVWEIR